MDRKDKLISEMRSSFHPQFTLHSLQRISERLCIEVTRIVDTDIDGKIIRWPVFSMQWELMTVCNADTNWLFTLYNNEYEFLDLYKAHKLMTSIQY